MLRVPYLVILLLAPLLAQAGVNPRNGNFYVTYMDTTLSAKGHELALNRTYNSKSTKVGWFGFGWGSTFETYLTVMPDQTAVISENGSGANTFYHDESIARNKRQVAAGVGKIVAAAKAQDKLTSAAVKALTKKLMESEEDRLSAVIKYHVQSQLSPKLSLTAFGRGYCAGKLFRTDSGYTRDNGCGTVDDFDAQGHLIRHSQNDGDDGYQFSLNFENDHPVDIVDSDGQSIHLSWTEEGQVSRITDSEGTTVTYKYDDFHNLTMANLLSGPFYRYDYDRNHNMTRIGYIDGSSRFMTYNGNGAATSVTETNGERWLYEYATAAGDPNKYTTRIREIAKDGSEKVQTQGFQDAYSATGERYLENHSVEDEQHDASTQFDKKGRITSRKIRSGETLSYTYHPTLDKVIEVKVDGKFAARYQYSANGELIHAEDADGQATELKYDDKKHISEMYMSNADGSHDHLSLKYDECGKPVELKHAELGVVKVQYDDKGEVRDAKSETEGRDGSRLAQRIVKMFQNILRLVRLAAV